MSGVLIFYILRAQEKRDLRQEEREKSYQDLISKLTDKFNIIQDVKNDVEEIKIYISKKIHKIFKFRFTVFNNNHF